MSVTKVAVPTNNPGGLNASRSDHFGHCDLFTLLDIKDGKVVDHKSHDNIAHDAGGCMVPVKVLAEAGVQAIIVGGMGARPLAGFAEVGITVYFAHKQQFPTVDDVVNAFVAGNLPVMQPTEVCKGGGNCHH
ncbi:MAG: dinitrogenase iron-molybdenum cofactor biosynthesis protein [Proteobacteria bacterium]|nr:dinitrogenase iron-molybdenum cofactor biosynthesis protein [Pseudomonadota bacterium]MBU1638982.1 dinitrogenase iron-molybdenum cofactor biosynthesis protein [Pseudomonadota bacterium]